MKTEDRKQKKPKRRRGGKSKCKIKENPNEKRRKNKRKKRERRRKGIDKIKRGKMLLKPRRRGFGRAFLGADGSISMYVMYVMRIHICMYVYIHGGVWKAINGCM